MKTLVNTLSFYARGSRFSITIGMLSALSFLLLAFTTTPTNETSPVATNLLYQSKDGGQTWQDISHGLPENQMPEDFFAGESDLYMRVNNVMYRSKSNLKTPVWEKENLPNPQGASIAFNRSGVMSFNYQGKIYQKVSPTTWLPRFTEFENNSMRTICETSDGTLFLGSDNGLFKSVDSGQHWKKVQSEGWVMNIVEAEGVLVATAQKGIMRSTDKGEHWEWVVREGGVGIAIERIEGGFAAIAYNTVTKSRRIRISLDNGKTWRAIDEGLRPAMSISSIKQVGKYLLCGHPDGIFRSSDLGKTWVKVHAGVGENDFKFKPVLNTTLTGEPREVFEIHVSGKVLYAVARGAGC